MAELDFITSNPATDSFQRAEDFAQKQMLSDASLEKARRDNEEAKLTQGSRLRKISAESDLAGAHATEAQAQLPYVDQVARAHADQATATAKNTALVGFDKSMEAVKAGNIPLAQAIAKQYGLPDVPPELANDAEMRAVVTNAHTRANEISDNPQYTQSFMLGQINEAQKRREQGLPVNPVTQPYTAPVPEGTVAPSGKTTFGKIGLDRDGNETYGFINPGAQTITPAKMPQQSGDQGGETSQLTGRAYLSTLSPARQNEVLGVLEGRQVPPTEAALKNPRTAALLRDAWQVEPGFDAALWAERRKMSIELGSSTPNSMGGIISNGKSAFEHLATLSDRLTDVGNYNGPDMPGGSAIARAGNWLANSPLTGSSTATSKVTGANDAGLKYGQESTKFYAGSGGGEGERLAALQALNPGVSSGNDQAEFLRTEKELMIGRLRQKENQIRQTMGDAYLARHPVMTPDVQQFFHRIDDNIARLHGNEPATSGNAAANPSPPLALDQRSDVRLGPQLVQNKDQGRAPVGSRGAPAPGIPQSAPAQGGGGVPPSAVQFLRNNPQFRDEFDAKYGAGAAAQVLGN